MSDPFRNPRPPAVADAFYPADPHELADMIDAQLAYARTLLGDKTGRRRDGMIDANVGASRGPAPSDGASATMSQVSAHSWPKAIIVPHAGYVYSGTTAALAYTLLAPGRGTIRRAVIVGPTHRVAVRGVACATYDAFHTPLGVVPVDMTSECHALGLVSSSRNTAAVAALPDAGDRDDLATAPPLRSGMTAAPGAPAPALIVNDPTHAQEHAVEVQVPFLQRVLGDIEIVPLNAGLTTSQQVGDVLCAFWGGPETVIVISSDLSHYHRERIARRIDDDTIRRITALDYPIDPDLACGAYPINGILDVVARGVVPGRSHSPAHGDEDVPTVSSAALRLEFLGSSTSGDDGVVALAGQVRPAMVDPDDRVVGYAAWAVWEESAGAWAVSPFAEQGTTSSSPGEVVGDGVELRMSDVSSEKGCGDGAGLRMAESSSHEGRGDALLELARSALRAHLGLPVDRTPADIVAAHPWLNEPGASFVTLNEHGDLRGCIGTLEAYRPLGRDVAAHVVDAAAHDPRFPPVTPDEYADLGIEVSVLSEPEPIMVVPAPDVGNPADDAPYPVRSRAELERALRPGRDGLIIEGRFGLHRATFLPQVWDDLPDPHLFVAHLLAKAGLSASTDWRDGEIRCSRYTVTAYRDRADA